MDGTLLRQKTNGDRLINHNLGSYTPKQWDQVYKLNHDQGDRGPTNVNLWLPPQSSLVATNRTSVPLAKGSVLLTWSGWRKSSDYYIWFVTNRYSVQIPHLADRVLSHALTVSLQLFLLKPKVFHLGWIYVEAAIHQASTISMPHW